MRGFDGRRALPPGSMEVWDGGCVVVDDAMNVSGGDSRTDAHKLAKVLLFLRNL